MTTKTISSYISVGYSDKGAYSAFLITSTGGVGGTGMQLNEAVTVTNDGKVHGSSMGVYFAAGGTLTNGSATYPGAVISGYSAVVMHAAGVVGNYGTIDATGRSGAGVVLSAGGALVNGSTAQTGALIESADFAVDIFKTAGTVTNFGTVLAGRGEGVYFNAGGTVTNGTATTPEALIQGRIGVDIVGSPGSVVNYGTIRAVGGGIYAVGLAAGGSVKNAGGRSLIEGADGIEIKGALGRVRNLGTVFGLTNRAVYLVDGGYVTNGAVGTTGAILQGATFGVDVLSAAGTVANYGTIDGAALVGVNLDVGGSILNGSATDTGALIEGAFGASVNSTSGTVTNFGSIVGTGVYGSYNTAAIYFADGGTVTNGSLFDTLALVEGANAGVKVTAGVGRVTNFGTIEGLGEGLARDGVYLDAGNVTNGAPTDRTARITGYTGVYVEASASDELVANYGTIAGALAGVQFSGVGSGVCDVTNGTANDTSAFIQGSEGVKIFDAGLVTNLGTIQGLSTFPPAYGVSLGLGEITNGNNGDRGALIEGNGGVQILGGGANQVLNFGTIRGSANYGIAFDGGGKIVNGTLTDRTALIEGYSAGALLNAGGTVTNLGTIRADGYGGEGVRLGKGGSVVNGAAGQTKALIEGYFGLYAQVGAAAKVTNFGTIEGDGGTAILFTAPSDVLVVEAGSSFIGAVKGGGGTLELGSGTGTLTGLFTGGSVTVSGSMATTTFTDFGTVQIDPSASFTLAGAGSIAAGQSLIDEGALSVAGTLTVAGTVTTGGTLSGTGTLAVTGGVDLVFPNTVLSIAKVSVSGATGVVVADTLSYAGTWTQSAGDLDIQAGDKMTFTGAGDSFSGAFSGSGAVAFTAGSDTFSGLAVGCATSVNGAAVTLAGTIALSSTLTVTSTKLTVDAAGASLTGGGTLALTNLVTNAIKGATAGATLTNVSDKIQGAGLIGGGQMTLVNDAGATIRGSGTVALTIDTGANTITNGGLIVNSGGGGVQIKSAVANTGVIQVTTGTLTAFQAVTGAGRVVVAGGTAHFASAFSEAVTFTAGVGTLELSASQAYLGTVHGFSTAGATFLDLDDIAFILGKTTATYAGSATSGVLTVTDGSHTAKIHMAGNFTTSTFVVADDGHGGVLVHDPAAAPKVSAFVAAAAAMGRGAGDSAAESTHARTHLATLARPGSMHGERSARL